MTNEEIKLVVMLEIISPEDIKGPYVLPEATRAKIRDNYKAHLSWEEVFAPIEDDKLRDKYIKLFNRLDEDDNWVAQQHELQQSKEEMDEAIHMDGTVSEG